jgi:hypothetical protein
MTLTERGRLVFRKSQNSPKGDDMKPTNYFVIGTLAASALVGSLVYASQYDDGDHAALPAQGLPPISLTQAVAIAERHAPGHAISAELEERDGRAFYEVAVATAGDVIEVKVDVGNGRVLGDKADHADTDADEEKRDRG